MAKKLKNKNKLNNEESTLGLMLRTLTTIYLAVVLAVVPLYAPDAYYSIGDYKWKLWIVSAYVYIGLILILGLIHFIKDVKKDKSVFSIESIKKQLSLIDIFVLVYMALCVISSIFSPYKYMILIGETGWYMGLLSQVAFCATYFAISRTWKYSNGFMRLMVVVSGLIFLYGIIMRFGVDPIGFYDGLTEKNKFEFISTLGQTSWYSSFMVLLIPIAISIYHNANTISRRIFGIIAIALGYMSMVTQNSDSAYLALAGYMLVYFWFSFDSYKDMMRFLEVIMINLLSFRFIGIMQEVKADQATKLDNLSMTISHLNALWGLLGIVLIIYIIMYLMNKKGHTPKVSRVSFLRVLASSLFGVAILAGIIYIALNTSGRLPGAISSDNNYLLFDERWGNNRGISWMSACYTFVHENVWREIFGTGPDTFKYSVYELCGQRMDDFYSSISRSDLVLSCAHNEWLNELITGGVLGLISYMGIYITSFIACMKNRKQYPELMGIAMALAAYVAHNVFCYQQVICTTVIFAFMGIAQAVIRNGYVDWDIWEKDGHEKNVSLSKLLKALFSV